MAAAPRGLSRAKLYALHTAALATSVAVAVACGGGTTTGSDASTDGNANDGTSNDAVSNNDATSDAVAADTGSDAASADVIEEDSHVVLPPYGCVFPGGCKSVIV